MDKDADAYRTISEVAQALDIPPHVLRFWETKFPQIKPLKRGGGRRYYRRGDTELLRTVRRLLYEDGYTIRGVQRLLKTKGGIALAAGEPHPMPESAAALAPDGIADEPIAAAGIVPMEDRAAALAAEVAACRAILTEALDAKGRRSGGPRS